MESHIRQVVTDYAWLLELAQERLTQYARLLDDHQDAHPYEVRTIEDETVYGERYLRGDRDGLAMPLEYLWLPDLAARVAAQQAAARAQAAAEQAAEAQARAERARARDLASWQYLVKQYGPAGPPRESLPPPEGPPDD